MIIGGATLRPIPPEASKKFQRSCCIEISRLTEKTERSAFSDQDQGDQIWRKFLPLRNFATLWLCISKFWALLS